MDGLRILYLWDADYPWDVRTAKICTSLTAAGVDVHIAARNTRRDPIHERLPEATVHRIAPVRWIGERLDRVTSFPAFFNPRWIRLLERVVRAKRPDVIMVRDLPLCPTAIRIARKHNIAVVLDMAENYPAMMEDIWLAGKHKPWDILVRNPRFVRMVEGWCVPRVDHVIVVVEESLDRLKHLYRMPARKMSVVSNTPSRSRLNQQMPNTPGEPGLNIVYLGLMEHARGVRDLIEAVARLRHNGIEARLSLIGDGRDLDDFVTHARDLRQIPDGVVFHGRLPHAEALRRVALANVGVVPHHANESWNTTIPNKIFDYMAAGLAVVSSNTVPCKRILAQTGAGVVYQSGDPDRLVEALSRLSDAQVRRSLGANGRAAVADRYNWENDMQRLWSALEHVSGRARMSVSQSSLQGKGSLE